MTRSTLKVTQRPAAPASGAKEASSRATRARLQRQRHAPAAPVAPVDASTPATPQQVKPPRAKPPQGKPPRAKPPQGKPSQVNPQRARPKPRDATAGNPDPEAPRLSKRMSELGLCSRREADEWIRKGWVTVDGKVVDVLGTRVSLAAKIEITRAAANEQGELVTILLHKPMGYVSGQAEDGYQPASVLVTPENQWSEDRSQIRFKPALLRGLAPAGRLDIDSTGLIVFTQDGRVAKRLIGQNSEVEKEYLVRVEGTLRDDALALLRHGLELDGVKLKPAQVSRLNADQLRFILREGRKRQIRRMCELVGLVVTGLKRVRSGNVMLGGLPVGQWRYLRSDERF